MPMLRSDAAHMMISSAVLDDAPDDDIRRLPLAVALPIMGAVSLGLWVLIYKLVSGIVASFG